MPVFFSKLDLKQYVDDQIAEVGGSTGGFPKYLNVESLPVTEEDGAIAVILDLDQLYIFDSPTGSWKSTGVSGSGGSGGTGDLTKADADLFYAPKTHSHNEYAPTVHSHNEFATLQNQINSMDNSAFEKSITILGNDEVINTSNFEKGKKFLQKGQLKFIDEVTTGTVSHPNFPVATEADLTAKGWTLTQNNMYNWATLNYRPFDGDPATYGRANTGGGSWFAVEFATPLQFQDMLVLNNSLGLKIEASVDGIVYETATNLTNAGTVKTEETFRMPTLKTYKKVKVSWTDAFVSTHQLHELKFLVAGSVTKTVKNYQFNDDFIDVSHYGINTLFEENAPYIQEAVDKNSNVFIPAGLFKIKTSIQVPSNTHILMHKDAIIQRNADIKSIFINKSTGVIGGYDANENITIEGGTLDGNYLAFPDGTAREYGQIVLCHTKNSKIKRVTLKNQDRWHMIELNSSRDILIEDCLFSTYVDIGAASSEALQIDAAISATQMPMTQGAPYDKTTCQNITIRNNTFDNVKDGIGTHSSEALKLHKNIKIQGNTFINGKGLAVKGLNWTDVTIENNDLRQQKNGIQLTLAGASAENIRVRNNREYEVGVVNGVFDGLARGINVKSNAATTERFRKVYIQNNTMELVGQHGIGFDYSEDVFVSGNSVKAVNQVGLWSYGAINFNIKDNVVKDTNRAQVLLATRCDIMIGSALVATATNDRGGIVSGNVCDSINFTNTDKVVSMTNISKKYLDSGNTNFVPVNNITIV